MNNRLLATGLALLLGLMALPAESGTQTRSSSFEYDPASGLLTKEIIEPNDPKLCLVTEYQYDPYGNKETVTTRNCDGSPGEAVAPSNAPATVNATATYTCPAGTTLTGTSCIPGAETAALSYTCPTGYTLSGTTCTRTVTATTLYSCPSDYTLSGTTCTSTVAATYNPQTVLFILTDGGSFTRTTQTNRCKSLGGVADWSSLQCIRLAYYSCPTGYTLSGTSCSLTVPATSSLSCPSGYTLSGTTCTSIVTATAVYSCPVNYTLTGTTCYPTAGAATPATATYSCPEGQTLSGTSCTTNANDAVIVSRTTRSTYDARGQFAETTTNALGHEERREYDPKFGGIIRLTGPNGLVTTWTYDGLGRKKTETRADGTSTTWNYLPGNTDGPANTDIKYTIQTQISGSGDTYDYYDLLGRKLVGSRRDFTGNAWIDEGRVEYDALGRVVKSYLPHERSTFANAKYATATYDLIGRPAMQTAADGSRVEIEYAGLVQTVYQAPNASTARKIVKTTTRNVLGQTVKIVDALNYKLEYTYDAFGNLETTTDHAQNVTRLYYDPRGRKTRMDDPDMGTWYYHYNALGELVRQVDAKSQTVAMAYDVLGRMLTRHEADLNSTWVYDTAAMGIGKLAAASADNGYRREHTYDAKGRLESTATTIDNLATPYTTRVTYDAYSRVDTQTYPTGFAVKNVYNSVGYLTSVVNATAQTTVYWRADTMDAAGHLLTQTYGNNLSITQTYYDTTGRLKTQLALDAQAIKRQDMYYDYDTLGNLKTRNDGVSGLGELFTYDDLNRLDSATVNSGGISAASYVRYDAIGNITCKSDISACGASTPNYTYNASGPNSIRPHAVAGITGTLNGFANPTFDYDANGNMIGGAGRTIRWTSFNIPEEITSCAGGNAANCKTTTFLYNPEHERTIEHQADGSTVHVLSPRYDTGLHFEKRVKADGSIEYEHYLYAGGLMFGKYITHTNAAGTAIQSTDMAGTQRDRVIEYYLKDHLGSITALVNGDANPAFLADGMTPNPEAGKYAVKFLSYDVWGKKRYPDGVPDPTGALNNPDMYHGYTGHEMLDEVGLIHMNGRLYDPVLGRFVSADFMIQSPDNLQSYNRYTYAWNNPLAGTDPSGQVWCIPCIGAIIGALSAGAQSNWDLTAMVQGAIVGGLAGWAGGAVGTAVSGSIGGTTGAIIGGMAGGAAAGLVSGVSYSAMGYNVDIGQAMALGALAGGVAQGVTQGMDMPPMVGQLAGGAAVSYVTGEDPMNGIARAFVVTAVSAMAQMAMASGDGKVQINRDSGVMDSAPKDGQGHQFAVKPNSLTGRLLGIVLGDPYEHYFVTNEKGDIYQATPGAKSGLASGKFLDDLQGREYVMSKETFDPANLANVGNKPYGLWGDKYVCTTFGRAVVGGANYNLAPGQMIFNASGGFRPEILNYDYSIYGSKRVK